MELIGETINRLTSKEYNEMNQGQSIYHYPDRHPHIQDGFSSTGSQLVEKVIDTSNDNTRRQQRGRTIMFNLLKGFEGRGNKL